MKMDVDGLVGKVEDFARAHVVPNLATDRSRFMLGFAWGGVKKRLHDALDALPKDGTVRGDDGLIDTEELRTCVKGGFDLAGSVLLDERLPLRFSQSDADLFFDGLK